LISFHSRLDKTDTDQNHGLEMPPKEKEIPLEPIVLAPSGNFSSYNPPEG
jgi:hypothetical protein